MLRYSPGDDSIFLSNSEIIKIMESSKTTYSITSTEELDNISISEFSKLYFPQLTHHVEYPLVVENDSSLYLKSFPFDSLAWKVLLRGEECYKDQDYEQALLYYKEAINLSENFYIAYLNAGDCHLMQNNFPEALSYYKKAYNINPYDYRCSFYQGTAYSKLEDYINAKKFYLNALVLKPRHTNLMNVLSSLSDKLEIDVNEQTFEPKALAKMEDGKVEIYLDLKNNTVWMAYAFAKAIWLGEKEVRLKLSNDVDTKWNSIAEKQALLCLMENYINLLDDNKIQHDEYLDRIMNILEDGYLDEFVIYEIASKMNPDVVLQLPKNFQVRIKEYLEKYVIKDLD